MEQREQSQAWLELYRVATEEDESQIKEIKERTPTTDYFFTTTNFTNYTNYFKAQIYLNELNELLSLCSNGTVAQ